jgi:hypothetical protein
MEESFADAVNHEKREAVMEKNRIHEREKSLLAEIKMTDVCNRTVIGVFVLWVVWVSTSLLIFLMR